MRNRYLYTTETDNARYKATRYPDIPISDADRYIISREGDRLDLLAQSFMGDVRAWWIIAEANNIGKGTLQIPPGVQIRIPDPALFYDNLLEEAEKEK